MRTRLTFGFVAFAAALAWLAPATVSAQARQRYPDERGQSTQVAYENGYREGLAHGQRDGRDGRIFNYEHGSVYRDGRAGWGGYGNREAYRHAFRRGYAEGYRTAYDQQFRARGSVVGRDPRYGTYPDVYARGGYGYPGAGGYARDYAFDRGYQEGYEEGRDAGRDTDRYDPQREKDYRKGDVGYDRRYGSRDYYKQSFRNGFLAGYDRGYREGRYERGGGWRLPW